VSEISEFLGRSLSAEETAEIVRRTRFDFMKTDPSANSWGKVVTVESPSEFMLKGERCRLFDVKHGSTVLLIQSRILELDVHSYNYRNSDSSESDE